MLNVSKAEHASWAFTSPTLKLHVVDGEGGGQQASFLVAKQAVEFPQVLVSDVRLCSYDQAC